MKKLILFMLSIFACGAVMAQVTTSSINGTVVDSERKPIVGATVVATHTPTGTVYAAATNRNGVYNIGGMRVGGPYTIEFSYIGCNNEKIEGVYLTIGEDAQFNVTLNEESTAIGEVVVMGQANPVFNSNRTGAQEVITRTMMDKLPTLDRSLDEFVKLTPMASNKNFAGTSYRFNNVTVDGASFNNSFGLSSSLGAAGIEPISLESIEQVQVMIAPFDVRNGGFTGGAINSVTKSGTNDFIGSAYFYHKGASLRGWRQKDLVKTVNEAVTNQYGFSLGGPILKNKFFFFVNAEFDRINEPVTHTTKTNNSRVDAADLDKLKTFLIDKFNYNPGFYDVTEVPTEANRVTARLDWNINKKNTLSLKYYFLDSYATNSPSTSGAPKNGRGPNEWAIPFSSQYYRGNNDFHIVMADLNTTINNRMSNTLKVGYSRLRDFRDMDGGFFPHVDILNGDGEAYTSFGTETNSYGNKLDTDIFQIQDNFTINAGKHQIVIGTQSDYRSFVNGYAYSFAGVWRFNSFDDFYKDASAYLDWKAAGADPKTRPETLASKFSQKYAIGGGFPEAEVKVLQLGFYLQDRWSIRDNFKLTYGLRIDVPIFLNDLDRNTEVEGMTFQGGIKHVDMSKLPKTKPMFSPRIGFNWDVTENHNLQVRGGTGLFTGTPPYVWISNQAGNNGLMFGDLQKGRPFDGIAEYQPSASDVQESRLDLAYTEKDFKYPQLWKTNLAVDYKFGNGWILTGELLYTKDVNAIYHANVGLNDPVGYVNDGDGKTRPYFSKGSGYYDMYINDRNANVIEMRNTSKGYSIFGTIQLQKQFMQGALRGLYLNASYTMGKAMSVTDGSSSVASSAWKYRPAINPNKPELSYGAGSFDGRLLISASYTANWSKNAATNFGLIYEMYRPWRYSFTYKGDVNGDGQDMNDLVFIPATQSDINLKAGKFESVDEAWKALDAFIEQDDYLSKHRGEYAERNGGVLPFEHQLDLSISHDIKIWCCKGTKCNTLRFSFDISNFLNLLNKDWGVKTTTMLGKSNSPQFQFLSMEDEPTASNNYTPSFTFQKDLVKSYKDWDTSSSRWAIMFGIKYMFN